MINKFKFYKAKDKPVNLDNVLDFTKSDDERIERRQWTNTKIKAIGLIEPENWEIFNVKEHPGLIFIRNIFTPIGQRYYIKKLLNDYTKNHPNNLLESRFSKNVIDDFWSAYENENCEKQKRLIKKSMRWTTLGLHYDWTNKVYDENKRDKFPEDLHELINTISRVIFNENFNSEAAIINFYPIGTTLAAHTDHSEICNSPLYSISFGQSAIFLIGGTQKEDEATPILLQSGDILIMAGTSRFCFHAVPRVFAIKSSDTQPWNGESNCSKCEDLNENDIRECTSEKEWSAFNTYLNDSRINVNVRQYKS